MKLDHCHRASCAQIIEALRAKVEELSNVYTTPPAGLAGEHILNLEAQVAALTQERDNYKAMIAEQWAQPELKAALADNAALKAKLEQEREKIRAEMINEAWSKTGEERSMK